MARRGLARRWFALLGALALFMSVTGSALADGTETLGAPSIPIADGSGTVAAGTGLRDTGAGTISLNVPGTPVQALLYWEVQTKSGAPAPTIMVDGSEVTGTLIGGPTPFFTQYETYVYRAEISVVSGANSLDIAATAPNSDNRRNNGAGLLVIFDDGNEADIGVFDGADVAFINAPAPKDVTVPQTFTFDAEGVDRVGTLTAFTASVFGPDFPDPVRPTTITVESGGIVTNFPNVLASNDGDEWDTFVASFPIPAGATSATVQVQSSDLLGTGNLPASLVWIGAGLVVPTTPDTPGGEGCTPGYWRQAHHYDSWTGYAPADSFDTVFGVSSSEDWTLGEAVEAKGGGENALARHAVAALLNASSPDVEYEYSAAEIIALVQDAYNSGEFEAAKDSLAYQNELGCDLD